MSEIDYSKYEGIGADEIIRFIAERIRRNKAIGEALEEYGKLGKGYEVLKSMANVSETQDEVLRALLEDILEEFGSERCQECQLLKW